MSYLDVNIVSDELKNNLTDIIDKDSDVDVIIPPMWCCTDNAAMIAKVAERLYKENIFADLTLGVDPSWQLDDFRNY